MSGHAFQGSAPENYERYLVPLIFSDYASDLAGLVPFPTGARVLEVACGTGAATAALLDAAPAGAHVTATDLSDDMVRMVKDRFDDNRIAVQTADGTDLPFGTSSFDALVCAFGVMFYPDRMKGYAEAARVLKPGGTFALSVWDSHERNPYAALTHETLGHLFPENPPMFLTVPFGYYDTDAIAAELEEAGFTEILISRRPRQSKAPNAVGIARGFVLASPVAGEIAAQTDDLENVIATVGETLEARYGERDLAAPMQAILITALAR
jgi:ubiquinone/menaquinone biosynthesis C-methylase UbiE